MHNITRKTLEKIYLSYNRPELISPDPLQFLSAYSRSEDVEIAGIIAALLAYGRVAQILISVEKILQPMGENPGKFLTEIKSRDLQNLYGTFKHRFTTGEEIIKLLTGISRIKEEYSSLEELYYEGSKRPSESPAGALADFTDKLREYSEMGDSHLLPNPSKGSACKRLHLFLRWMVRRDSVDPGCWKSISPSTLIVPLDTHMLNFGLCYGFTERRQGNLKTALEITEKFRSINPEDPVKYDFSLTRFGIRNDLCWENLEEIIKS